MGANETPISVPLTISRKGPDTLQQQISSQLRQMIVDRQLPPGTRLSSIREFARQLDVSVNTVRFAYQELISEGIVTTAAAAGTFVASPLPQAQALAAASVPAEPAAKRHFHRFPPVFRGSGAIIDRARQREGVIDFWAGRTDPRRFPVREWRRLVNLHLQHSAGNLTDYGDPAGFAPLRQAISDHLARARGFRPTPEQVLITGGIQQALSVVAMLLLAPGSGVVTELPTYHGATAVFRGFGAHVIRVPVDNDGLVTDRLPNEPVALSYVTPSHQHPTGHIMSMERRARLLDWSARNGAYVIEDDYDSDFCFESGPLPALASLDTRGSVIYLGTFSKTMGAGLRLGYMVVPEELVDVATNVMAMVSFGRPWLDQAVMADYIASGSYALRLRQLRTTSGARLDDLREALRHYFGDAAITGLGDGMHVIWHLPPEMPSSTAMCQAALPHGVRVYSPKAGGADVTGFEAENERMLIFGYASLTSEEIWTGLARLASVRF